MGGIYEVLELLYSKAVKEGLDFEFTKEEVVIITGLGLNAVTNNLNKLVKSGFLTVRYDVKDHHRGYYKLKGEEVGKFVINCLR